MPEMQLTLDGREIEHPVVHSTPLTDKQRLVLAYVRQRDEVRPWEIGKLMHAGRETGCPARSEHVSSRHLACCAHGSADGNDALRRLERRGLVERLGWGRWRATDADEEAWSHHSAMPSSDHDEIVRLYVEERLTQRQISERLHYEHSTVARHLADAGVEMKRGTRDPRFRRLDRRDPDGLLRTLQLYAQGYTAREIAAMEYMSESSVRYRVRHYGRDGVRHGGDAQRVPRARRARSAGSVSA
jgi:DNA-directed RNA polymerase specialized sigma24 family protein